MSLAAQVAAEVAAVPSLTNVGDVAAMLGAGGGQSKTEPKPPVSIADGLDDVDLVTNLGGEVWYA